MHRVPNLWRKNNDGTLTYFLETDEFKQTLTYMKKLYDAGVFHPDTATGNRTQRKDFITGFSRNPSGRWIARLADGTEQPVGRLYSDRVRAIAGR